MDEISDYNLKTRPIPTVLISPLSVLTLIFLSCQASLFCQFLTLIALLSGVFLPQTWPTSPPSTQSAVLARPGSRLLPYLFIRAVPLSFYHFFFLVVVLSFYLGCLVLFYHFILAVLFCFYLLSFVSLSYLFIRRRAVSWCYPCGLPSCSSSTWTKRFLSRVSHLQKIEMLLIQCTKRFLSRVSHL